jgi:hypothetical protein
MSLKKYRIIVVCIVEILIPMVLGIASQSFLVGFIAFIVNIPVIPIVLFTEPKKLYITSHHLSPPPKSNYIFYDCAHIAKN